MDEEIASLPPELDNTEYFYALEFLWCNIIPPRF
jgi:hypothetical protein